VRVVDYLVEVANEHVVGLACRTKEAKTVLVEEGLRSYVGRASVAVAEALRLRDAVRE